VAVCGRYWCSVWLEWKQHCLHKKHAMEEAWALFASRFPLNASYPARYHSHSTWRSNLPFTYAM
jgi:hypothetical protein